MYLNQNVKAQSERCFSYNVSRGIEGFPAGEMGKVVRALNMSTNKICELSPSREIYKMEYPNDAISTGSYLNNVYYNTKDGFYFNGVKKGRLTDGEKTFLNFDGRVYIFPDRAYYDVANDKFLNFYREVTANINIIPNKNQYEAKYHNNSTENLAEYFADSVSIEIKGSYDGLFDGCFKINSVDIEKGIVKFGYAEANSNDFSTQVVTISNKVPALSGACVCKNRIFGYCGNKIYASALGDGVSWCDPDEESGSFGCVNVGGDDFTACNTIDDQCVFFTQDKIFKIYGDSIKEFSLKLVSSYGGVENGFFSAHASVLGDIYFMSRNSILKFSGSRSDVVCRLNESEIYSGKCFPYKNKLYFHYFADSGEHLCALDVDVGVVYELNITGVKGFLGLYDNACVMTDNEIISIEGRSDRLPQEFSAEGPILSVVEFNEIHNGWDRFSPAKLYLRGRLAAGSELDVYCMLGNSGEWSQVYKLTREGERLSEFSLPASLTDSFRLKLVGKGDYSIGNIYVLFS